MLTYLKFAGKDSQITKKRGQMPPIFISYSVIKKTLFSNLNIDEGVEIDILSAEFKAVKYC
tara:strand:+ start:146931 stop:147113 length:183 start_codon:yes stop_codon:yes gene_type:complete